jgi:hypothetical protein
VGPPAVAQAQAFSTPPPASVPLAIRPIPTQSAACKATLHRTPRYTNHCHPCQHSRACRLKETAGLSRAWLHAVLLRYTVRHRLMTHPAPLPNLDSRRLLILRNAQLKDSTWRKRKRLKPSSCYHRGKRRQVELETSAQQGGPGTTQQLFSRAGVGPRRPRRPVRNIPNMVRLSGRSTSRHTSKLQPYGGQRPNAESTNRQSRSKRPPSLLALALPDWFNTPLHHSITTPPHHPEGAVRLGLSMASLPSPGPMPRTANTRHPCRAGLTSVELWR